MSRKEDAVNRFKFQHHNCAQAVACAYADKVGIDEETIFRIIEGFGGGIAGSGHVCGALSGLCSVASMSLCPKMDINNPTKKTTYPAINKMVKEFEERQGSCDCRVLLKTKDNTLIDGKKAGCIKCVTDCCDILDEFFKD